MTNGRYRRRYHKPSFTEPFDWPGSLGYSSDRVTPVEKACPKCGTVSKVSDQDVPLGWSFIVCPACKDRIDIFKGAQVGMVLKNLAGMRFFAETDSLMDRYCEPGELWRVTEVIEPCPDKGRGRACEIQNRGRCPNQRLIVRLVRDTAEHKTCLYRKARLIFDIMNTYPVGRLG